MKLTRKPSGARGALNLFLGLSFTLTLFTAVHAQQAPTEEVPEAEAVQRRVTRARSLAAVGKLAAAAAELDALSASTTDETVREVSRILLMGIFVEMPDYARANALLDESFKARTAQNESASRSYYALAGQTVKSVRMHIERYRTFGINVADEDLPSEAKGDLEQLRVLLERVFEHAKSIREDESKSGATHRGSDATALIEEAANTRLRLARSSDDRAHWQQVISDARQRLFASETRIGKISDAPIVQVASTTPVIPASLNSYTPAAPANTNTENKPKPEAKERASEVSKAAPPAPQTNAVQAGVEASKASGDASATKDASSLISVGALHSKAERSVNPSYPQFAKMARISGVVTVYVVVNEKGVVEAVQRADGPAQLQNAATDAVRRWRFKPTVIDGQPVRVSGYVNFNFSL